MIRILTIIALLFGPPAWAKKDIAPAQALKNLRDGQILFSNIIEHKLHAVVKMVAELFHCAANQKQVWCTLYQENNQ